MTCSICRVAVLCLGHLCLRGTRQRADHFSIAGTRLSICIPVTVSLEMLDPCLGGKGKMDVAEGTLESVPAVTKPHQLGWWGGGVVGWWAYEHMNPLLQFRKVTIQHKGAGRFSISGERTLGFTGFTLWCAHVMGEARPLEVSRALTPFKRFHLRTSSLHGGATFRYHHFSVHVFYMNLGVTQI